MTLAPGFKSIGKLSLPCERFLSFAFLLILLFRPLEPFQERAIIRKDIHSFLL